MRRMGRFDEGLRTIDESFPIIERSAQRFYEAEVHRAKGELLLAQDAMNVAQAAIFLHRDRYRALAALDIG